MSEQSTYAGYGSPAAGDAEGGDVSMKDKAGETAQAGGQAASVIAQTAADHVKDVAGEVQGQARNLVGEARDHLHGHAGEQHRNAVTNLRSLSNELRSMADGSPQGGVASELVSQAAERTHSVADWLDEREPEDVLEELRRFARRRPGAFLIGALAAGVVAGRLTRGAVAAHSDDGEASPASQPLQGGADFPRQGAGSVGAGSFSAEPGAASYGSAYGVPPDLGTLPPGRAV